MTLPATAKVTRPITTTPWSDYNRSKTGGTDEDFDYFEKKLADTQSLYRQVENQITLNFTAPRQRIIAGLLSEQLDAAGYFRGKTADIAKALKTTENEITDVLQKLKTFEPSGLFAQDLKECLEIQLREIILFCFSYSFVSSSFVLRVEGLEHSVSSSPKTLVLRGTCNV